MSEKTQWHYIKFSIDLEFRNNKESPQFSWPIQHIVTISIYNHHSKSIKKMAKREN